MGRFDDWGVNKIDKNHPDTSWIDNLEVYPKTPLYRLQYQSLADRFNRLGIEVNSYLSLGTGLGRHVILLKEHFPLVKKVVTVDHAVAPHKSVLELNLVTEHLQMPVINALSKLANNQLLFDFICFENIGHEHEVSDEASIYELSNLIRPGGILAIIGDTKFDTDILVSSDSFNDISTPEEWGDTTKNNLWQRV